MDREVIDLYLDDIIPNRFQPREIFEEKALKELADSIREHGVIQPIIVRKIGDKYEIIAGERRYKASAIAGLTKIPAIIRNLDDKESSKVALLENLQRRDLSAIEEARTYQKILDLDSMTQEELGKTMGKSQAAIANKLRLLALPDEIQEALLNDQISERHARSLLNLSNSQDQIDMLQKIIQNRMTVRELDNEIKLKLNKDVPPVISTPSREITANTVVDLDQLKQQSSDIIQPTRQTANIDDLLRPTAAPQTASISTGLPTNIPATPEASSVPSFLTPTEPVRIEEPEPYQPFTNTESLINEYKTQQNVVAPEISISPSVVSQPSGPNVKGAINTVRSAIATLEQQGFRVHVDEVDLAENYQITVTIEKNN